jgi:predicted nucleic acid-binding protein
MSDTWIVDASPLIALAKVNLLDLLTAPARHVWIADTVVREVSSGPTSDPARLALESGWGERRADALVPSALAAWRLDAGEEAVLALALATSGARAVLDDGDGRRAARSLGIPIIGTVGVVAEARREGRIEALAPALRALALAGLYLPPDTVLAPTLAAMGEAWP